MFWNPSIYNILLGLARPIGQTTRQPRVWCSKYNFFRKIFQNSLQKVFQFFFCKITKMKIKSFEWPKSIRNCEKIYTWKVSCLSHWRSRSAYYIVDCRICKSVLNSRHRWQELIVLIYTYCGSNLKHTEQKFTRHVTTIFEIHENIY